MLQVEDPSAPMPVVSPNVVPAWMGIAPSHSSFAGGNIPARRYPSHTAPLESGITRLVAVLFISTYEASRDRFARTTSALGSALNTMLARCVWPVERSTTNTSVSFPASPQPDMPQRTLVALVWYATKRPSPEMTALPAAAL